MSLTFHLLSLLPPVSFSQLSLLFEEEKVDFFFCFVFSVSQSASGTQCPSQGFEMRGGSQSDLGFLRK